MLLGSLAGSPAASCGGHPPPVTAGAKAVAGTATADAIVDGSGDAGDTLDTRPSTASDDAGALPSASTHAEPGTTARAPVEVQRWDGGAVTYAKVVPLYGGPFYPGLHTIVFAPGSTKVLPSPENDATLAQLAELSHTHRIVVDGYADASEEPDAARLSLERAKNARREVINRRGDAARVVAAGHGVTQAVDLSAGGRRVNPRVWFTVLDP